ncbi:MAG: lycopene beta-cyclase CrtY [Pseudomonadota bacterium]
MVDVAIAGGGLSGGLIAWRLKQLRPDISVAVVERGERLGGNHTWSFHESDLPPVLSKWVDDFIVHRWPRQRVRFSSHSRLIETGYRSATSDRLHELVAPVLGENLITNAHIKSLSPDSIALEDGRVIEAGAVIDARGQGSHDALTIAFQKFVGLELKFTEPHGQETPIIMDATISQTDGYRFFYVLPFSNDTALVEDTYYSDARDLPADMIQSEILDYCASAGWKVEEILRRETGILPIALAGDIEAHYRSAPEDIAIVGLRAALFHPLTGYSLPDAARMAEKIANADDFSGPALAALARKHAVERWHARRFYRMLSRFLYYAAAPHERHLVLARFYRLSRPLIERFYASGSTRKDKLRVLVGKPPVSFMRAVECVDERIWLERYWRPRDA